MPRVPLTLLGGAALMLLGAVGGDAVLTAVGVVTLVSAPLGPLRGGLPLGALACLGASTVVLLTAGVVGVDVFSGPVRLVALVLVAAGALALTILASRGSSDELAAAPPRAALLPAMVMAGVALHAVVRGLTDGTGWMVGGDNMRHLQLLVRTLDAGNLTYGIQAYPRGWHSFVALTLGVDGGGRTARTLLADLSAQAALAGLAYSLLALVVATTASHLAALSGHHGRVRSVAGFLGGAFALAAPFAAEFLARGFQTSVVAALALAVPAGELARHPGSRRALLASSLAVLIVAHSWQLLLPVGVVLWLIAAVTWVRTDSRAVQRRLVAVAAVSVGLAGLSAPGLLAVNQPSVGVKAAATAGDAGSLPWVWLAVIGVGVAVCVSLRRTIPTVTVAAAWGSATASALVLSWYLGISPAEYYPNKMLCTAALLGLPAVAAVTAQGLAALDDRRSPAARIGTVVGGAMAALVAIASIGSVASSVMGTWTSADAGVVERTILAAGDDGAAVVWDVGSPFDDATSQMLLDYYVARPSDPTIALPASTVSEQCALLAASPQPVVISSRSAGEVEARFSCVPGVRTTAPAR